MAIKNENLTAGNRRAGIRVNRQVKASCANQEGLTLNISDQGARLVLRSPVPWEFDMTLDLGQPVALKAERVWEQQLGPHGTRVVGVRFEVNQQVAAWVRAAVQG